MKRLAPEHDQRTRRAAAAPLATAEGDASEWNARRIEDALSSSHCLHRGSSETRSSHTARDQPESRSTCPVGLAAQKYRMVNRKWQGERVAVSEWHSSRRPGSTPNRSPADPRRLRPSPFRAPIPRRIHSAAAELPTLEAQAFGGKPARRGYFSGPPASGMSSTT